MSLMMSGGDLGASAFPKGESIFTWISTIEGGKGTIYEGLSYKLSLHFPVDYPFKPPQDKRSSAYDCRTLLLSIQSLVGEPNPESLLNGYAATSWNNKEDYKKMVQKQYFAGKAFES